MQVHCIPNLYIVQQDDGSYPLHVAVLSKSYQMLSLLVPYYDSLDMIDVVKHVSISITLIAKLIQSLLCRYIFFKDHKTALMLACKEKNYEFVRLLVEHTADVNTKDCVSVSKTI